MDPLQWMGAVNFFFFKQLLPLMDSYLMMDWRGVDYLWMFLSAVWTLILTAPIHCRGSIAEQAMSCLISSNLFWRRNKLILDGLRTPKYFIFKSTIPLSCIFSQCRDNNIRHLLDGCQCPYTWLFSTITVLMSGKEKKTQCQILFTVFPVESAQE